MVPSFTTSGYLLPVASKWRIAEPLPPVPSQFCAACGGGGVSVGAPCALRPQPTQPSHQAPQLHSTAPGGPSRCGRLRGSATGSRSRPSRRTSTPWGWG